MRKLLTIPALLVLSAAPAFAETRDNMAEYQ